MQQWEPAAWPDIYHGIFLWQVKFTIHIYISNLYHLFKLLFIPLPYWSYYQCDFKHGRLRCNIHYFISKLQIKSWTKATKPLNQTWWKLIEIFLIIYCILRKDMTTHSKIQISLWVKISTYLVIAKEELDFKYLAYKKSIDDIPTTELYQNLRIKTKNILLSKIVLEKVPIIQQEKTTSIIIIIWPWNNLARSQAIEVW